MDHLEVRERVHPTPERHPELAAGQLGVVHVEDFRWRRPVNARRAPQPHDLGLVVGLVVVRRIDREDAVVLPYDDAVWQFIRVRRLLLRIFKVKLTWKCTQKTC